LEVYPFALHVITGSGEKYYDGEPLSNSVLENLKLASTNHVHGIAEGEEYKEITNAGSIVNEYHIQIADEEGAPVTHNYDITYEYGTLTVKKMPVTVTLSDKEETEYDGTEKFPDLSGEYFDIQAIDEESTANLKLTHEDFTTVLHVRSMIDAGTYSYSVNFKEKSSSDNYVLEVKNYGYLTIKPRAITVETGSAEKPYDGKPLTCNTAPNIKSANKLVDGHQIVLPEKLPSITNYGTVDNDYKVTVLDSDGKDKTANYKITYEYGELKITACEITVTLKNFTEDNAFTYNGKEVLISADDAIVSITPANSAKKSDFKVVPDETLKNAGTYSYNVEIADEEYAENYEITCSGGTVTINALPVTVTLKNYVFEYSGKAVEIDIADAAQINTPLLNAGNLKLQLAEIINAGDYTYGVGFADGFGGAGNFDLTAVGGKIKVTPLSVNLTLKNAVKEYDGDEYDLTEDTLVLGEDSGLITDLSAFTATYIEGGDRGNAGTYHYTVALDNENFRFNSAVGTVTVNKRAVTFYTADHSTPYTGNPVSHPVIANVINLRSALHYYEADADTASTVTDVGSVDNKVVCLIRDNESNADVSSNYSITYVYGKLTVTPCPVTIVTGTKEFTYNGEEQSDGTISDGGALAAYKAKAEVLPGVKLTTITNAGSVKNEFPVKIVADQGGADITRNFAITYVYGTLTVKPMDVT
ncbi:MAG: hypothetical protein K2O67_02775, partial [Clostridia bacterium]|nr:hypothetical protein [Clostridia bacterium]